MTSLSLEERGSLTANISVDWSRGREVEGLHDRIAQLQLDSPGFGLDRHNYTLALLLHARWVFPPRTGQA